MRGERHRPRERTPRRRGRPRRHVPAAAGLRTESPSRSISGRGAMFRPRPDRARFR